MRRNRIIITQKLGRYSAIGSGFGGVGGHGVVATDQRVRDAVLGLGGGGVDAAVEAAAGGCAAGGAVFGAVFLLGEGGGEEG